jgi:hypothetical protein
LTDIINSSIPPEVLKMKYDEIFTKYVKNDKIRSKFTRDIIFSETKKNLRECRQHRKGVGRGGGIGGVGWGIGGGILWYRGGGNI